jgi:hypothetical protein
MTVVEYIVKYYWKDGFTNSVRFDNYGAALYEADNEYISNKDVIGYYEITKVTTSYELMKSNKE